MAAPSRSSSSRLREGEGEMTLFISGLFIGLGIGGLMTAIYFHDDIWHN